MRSLHNLPLRPISPATSLLVSARLNGDSLVSLSYTELIINMSMFSSPRGLTAPINSKRDLSSLLLLRQQRLLPMQHIPPQSQQVHSLLALRNDHFLSNDLNNIISMRFTIMRVNVQLVDSDMPLRA